MEDTPLLIIWPQACRLNSLRLGALSVKVVSTHVTGFVRIKQTTLKDYNTCQVRSQHSEVSAGLLMTSLGHWVHSPSQATRTRQGTDGASSSKQKSSECPFRFIRYLIHEHRFHVPLSQRASRERTGGRKQEAGPAKAMPAESSRARRPGRGWPVPGKHRKSLCLQRICIPGEEH